MALCKLHHWALDAHLVAPDTKYRWVVSGRLDRRRNSERELTRFHRSPILLPQDAAHYPATESMRWCLDRLTK
jgi:putative restriction endonuclease